MLTCPSCGRSNPAEASFCMGCATPLGATATAHETRKTVSALFCDLVGSTTLGEQHDPEVLRPLLHAYFEEMRAAVERHGGRVEKFIGDAVNAVFGLPVAHEDDALRAIRAAAEMIERLARLTEAGPIPLACRIGVNTGEVLVPAHGEPLIGDAINTAARLQANAEPGSVLIGEPTWRLVRDAVVAEPVAPLLLKGKAGPVNAWRLVRVASMSPVRARRLDAPMVGRRRESILLEQAYERAESDRACQLFTVLGTAGTGKSRLVEEFLAGRGNAVVIRGRCLPYGEGITWFPVAGALKEALGLEDFGDEASAAAAIAAALGDEEHAASIARNLAALLGAAQGGTPEETSWAVRRFLEARARERPLVVVFDDIHWGEPAFLDLVEHVADWARDASILMLCMARPELLDVRPAWAGGKTNATTISLAPLTDAEAGNLIDLLLGSAALPDDVRARITRIAGGNPLFVEEMLRMLVDDGLLIRDGDGWTATAGIRDVRVPPTISALLSARLDRLTDEERMIVEAASVSGQEFHRGAIRALLPEVSHAAVDGHLRTLVRRELVGPERSRLPGDEAYRFRHILIRDAAYDAIPKTERSQFHRAFADWMDGVAGERVAEQQEILGYHLERAYRYREELGLPEDRELRLRAARALGSAGRRAVDGGDLPTAIALLRPAAALAHGDRIELWILDDLMIALDDAAETGATEALDREAEAAIAHDDPVFMARTRYQRYVIDLAAYSEPWDDAYELELLGRTLAIYHEHGATRFEVSTRSIRTGIGVARGHVGAGADDAAAALELALAQGHSRPAAGCFANMVFCLVHGPEPITGAVTRCDEFLARWSAEPRLEAEVLVQRAQALAWLGRADDARTDHRRASRIATDLGLRSLEIELILVDGYLSWLAGDLQAAAIAFRSYGDARTTSGDRLSYTWLVAPDRARVLLDTDGTLDPSQAVAEVQDDPALPAMSASYRSLRGIAAAGGGDIETACRLADEALAIADNTDLGILRGDVALDRAHVLRLAGRPDEARASGELALERFERKEYAIGIHRAEAFLAALPG